MSCGTALKFAMTGHAHGIDAFMRRDAEGGEDELGHDGRRLATALLISTLLYPFFTTNPATRSPPRNLTGSVFQRGLSCR